jgi:hypothetical protein
MRAHRIFIDSGGDVPDKSHLYTMLGSRDLEALATHQSFDLWGVVREPAIVDVGLCGHHPEEDIRDQDTD